MYPLGFLINQCQIITFLILKSDNIENSRIKLKGIVLQVPSNQIKGSSQHKVGGEWFEIKLGKISRMLVKYEVLPIPNVIFVC